MKLQEHANKLETNVQAETENFGIGDASVVIEILRNRLYENKVQTLVQEYICNARDAMRELGKGNKFEVSVPTKLSPTFKVRDFGPGITPDRMKNVFVMYGASTKRDSNNQTGGFGIGAKSAWSYTDSFNIITCVDGTRRTYIAHTGVNNNGRLDLISTESTDEPNGTEIQVAVKPNDINEFRSAIQRAIYFWKERPKLRGEAHESALTEGYRIGDTLEVVASGVLPSYVCSDSWNTAPIIVIDGVIYEGTSKLIDKCEKLRKLSKFIKKKLILHIGNGLVDVSASRESIADSKRSIEALDKVAMKCTVEVKTHLADAFGKVKSNAEFIKTYTELDPYFILAGFAKYGDYEIENDWLVGEILKDVQITHITCNNRRGRKGVKVFKNLIMDTKKQLPLKHLKDVFFLDKTENKIVQNKRVREYFKTNTTIYLVEPKYATAGLPADMKSYNKVIADLNANPFSSVVYAELPKEQRVKVVREKKEFCLHATRGERYRYTTLDTNGEKWFYVPMDGPSYKGYSLETLRDLSYYLKEKEGANVCGVTEKVEKIVKNDPNFIPLEDYLSKFKPSKDDICWLKRLERSNDEQMRVVQDIKGIKDGFLAEMAEEYKAIEKAGASKLPTILKGLIKELKEVKEFKEKDEKLTKVIDKDYPLLKVLDGYSKNNQEVVFYLNAKHSANRKGR